MVYVVTIPSVKHSFELSKGKNVLTKVQLLAKMRYKLTRSAEVLVNGEPLDPDVPIKNIKEIKVRQAVVRTEGFAHPESDSDLSSDSQKAAKVLCNIRDAKPYTDHLKFNEIHYAINGVPTLQDDIIEGLISEARKNLNVLVDKKEVCDDFKLDLVKVTSIFEVVHMDEPFDGVEDLPTVVQISDDSDKSLDKSLEYDKSFDKISEDESTSVLQIIDPPKEEKKAITARVESIFSVADDALIIQLFEESVNKANTKEDVACIYKNMEQHFTHVMLEKRRTLNDKIRTRWRQLVKSANANNDKCGLSDEQKEKVNTLAEEYKKLKGEEEIRRIKEE